VGKADSITNSESAFVALVIHHAMRRRHIVICGLSGFTIYFHIITKNSTIFEKKKTEPEIVFSINLCETFLILGTSEPDTVRNVHWYS
jgi:hypothetical protein